METEQQSIEARHADLCARVVDKNQQFFIRHLEIQNQNQRIMPERMFALFYWLTYDCSTQMKQYISMLDILASNRNLGLGIRQAFKVLHVEIAK